METTSVLKKISTFSTSLLISLTLIPNLARAGSHNAGTLSNPLALDSIQDLLLAIVNIFQIVATPLVVFFIIYSGFLYVTARGNTETLDKAKQSLIYAIIGGVVIVGAVAISAIVGNTAGEFNT